MAAAWVQAYRSDHGRVREADDGDIDPAVLPGEDAHGAPCGVVGKDERREDLKGELVLMADREKVIKGLEVCTSIADDELCPKDCPYYQEVCYGYDQLMRDALALLKEQEAVVPKWTSVKERYPEEEGFYLVSADHGNYHPWIAEMRIFKGIKGFCNGATMPCVGAWMPLPEPYKEGR